MPAYPRLEKRYRYNQIRFACLEDAFLEVLQQVRDEHSRQVINAKLSQLRAKEQQKIARKQVSNN